MGGKKRNTNCGCITNFSEYQIAIILSFFYYLLLILFFSPRLFFIIISEGKATFVVHPWNSIYCSALTYNKYGINDGTPLCCQYCMKFDGFLTYWCRTIDREFNETISLFSAYETIKCTTGWKQSSTKKRTKQNFIFIFKVWQLFRLVVSCLYKIFCNWRII